LNEYTANRLTDEFHEKSWTKLGVNKLFRKLQDTDTGGQAAADRAVPALKKTLRQLMVLMSQKDKPQTHRTVCEISREMSIHQSSVSRIICKDLHLKCFKKRHASELTDANCAACIKRAKLLLQKFSQSATDFVFFADEKVFSVASTDNWQNDSVYAHRDRTEGSAALSLSACCAVVQQVADFIEENSHALVCLVCLNISSILLVHKYTQHTQLHV